MIKAITFDLWNTLFKDKSYSKYRLEVLIKFLQARTLFYDFERIKQAYDTYFSHLGYNPENASYFHIYNKERVLNLLKALNLELTSSNVQKITKIMEESMLRDPPSLKDGVKETLEGLAPYYKIGIISDTGITPGYVIRKVLDEYNILQYFQATIFSDEIGFYKPHSHPFKKALKKLKCKPDHSIHVGDLLQTDVIGAKAFGMRAIWLNDTNQLKLPEIRPDYEIHELFEVVNIVTNLN